MTLKDKNVPLHEKYFFKKENEKIGRDVKPRRGYLTNQGVVPLKNKFFTNIFIAVR
jgi:hypothetical protein